MLKKIINKITSSSILFVAFPLNIFKATIFQGSEQSNVTDTVSGIKDAKDALKGSGITGTDNIGDLLLKYVNFVLPYLALAAFLAFVYSGVLYITAFGNEEQTQKVKKVLIYTVIGLVLVILSYSIVQLLTSDLVRGINK